MKVEIEVCGFKVRAESDYHISPCLSAREQEAVRTAVFARLCNEARAVAKDYIVARFNNGKKGDGK